MWDLIWVGPNFCQIYQKGPNVSAVIFHKTSQIYCKISKYTLFFSEIFSTILHCAFLKKKKQT
jgi:hypothetical protein